MGLMDRMRQEGAVPAAPPRAAAQAPASAAAMPCIKPVAAPAPAAPRREGATGYEVDVLPAELDAAVRAVAERTRDRLSARLGSDADVSAEDAMDTAMEVASRLGALAPLDAETRTRVAREAVNDLFLLGPLEPLLADESVTEVMVNGPDEVYVERYGTLHLTNVRLLDDDHILSIVSRLASEDDKHCDKGTPMCNATLHRSGAAFDGSRLNLTVPPVAVDHPTIDVRKFRADVVTPDALMAAGEYDGRCGEILSAMVRARMNILVMGGTGSGKTTLLNALSCYIPDNERIITVEDTVELKLNKPHLVRMTTRQKSSEGTGEITIRDLVINTLRQRPDRIIVGECRGEEAFDMLQAMSTGHDGALTTIHANNARHALSRLQMMIQMAPSAGNMAPADIMKVITDAVDVVVHVKRWPNGERHVDEIVEIQGVNDTGVPIVAPVVLFDEAARAWVPTGEKLTAAHRARFESNGVKIDDRWWMQWA